jgi:hypothetical protein
MITIYLEAKGKREMEGANEDKRGELSMDTLHV